MEHRGVEYTVVATATPGIWRWQFQIGNTVSNGQTETRLELLARRRVQLRINQVLKQRARANSGASSILNPLSR